MSAGRGCGRRRKSWSLTEDEEAAVKGRFAVTVVRRPEGSSGGVRAGTTGSVAGGVTGSGVRLGGAEEAAGVDGGVFERVGASVAGDWAKEGAADARVAIAASRAAREDSMGERPRCEEETKKTDRLWDVGVSSGAWGIAVGRSGSPARGRSS